MSNTWQDIAAIALIAAATAYVIRRIWRAITGRQPPGCASCSVCSQPPNDRVLISIDPMKSDPMKLDPMKLDPMKLDSMKIDPAKKD